MDRTLKRREFLNWAAGISLLPLGFQLIGCGRPEEMDLSNGRSDEGAKYITVKDIQVHLRGIRGARAGVLKAADIVAGNEVTLYYVEGPSHRHPFTLTKTEYAKLIRGETVVMETDRAQGHTHSVEVNPAYNPANADSVDIEQDSTAKLFAALSEDESPELYIAADQELAENSARYCTELPQTCDADESLWKALQSTNEISGIKSYKTGSLVITNDATISIKAKDSSNKAIKKVFKFVAKAP